MDIGSAVSRASGISAEKMEALADYKQSTLFSETERLVLEYADAMTETPVEVSEALFAKLREKFSNAQLVELTAALAWENYRARFDHAFGVEAEGFTKGSYCVMPVRPVSKGRAATP
jgi:alkylhydroperoxidase family enzyme